MKFYTRLFTYCALGVVALFQSCTSSHQAPTEISLIPQPAHVAYSSGSFSLKDGMTIGVNDPSLIQAADYLSSFLNRSTGYGFSVREAQTGDIYLYVDTLTMRPNEYELIVTAQKAELKSGSYPAMITAIQTLRQLLPAEIESTEVLSGMKWTIPTVEIKDAPRFEWRGLMLDVSRHFYTPEEIKELLDLMALYKLNKFHWHLTDDQGWRIEIKQYPLLTEKGAWRTFNNHDFECKEREVSEMNPDFKIPNEHLRIDQKGDTLYGGFYTQDEIRDIVRYAQIRGIDVIPEIDMPGHFLAAITSYKGISCSDQPGWGAMFSSPVCPGKESALTFCKNIYSEIFDLFPYEYVHLGADEVEKTNWKKCSDCQKRIKAEKLKSEDELQAWFVKYMERFFNENGKKMIGWDEIIEGGLSETATVMWWRSWAPNSIPEATAQGNKTIATPNAWLYFDAHQDKRSLLNVYDFEPTATVHTPEQKDLIMGVQGNIWCEGIPSRERMQFMLTPRLLALSEIAWIDPATKNEDTFLEKVIGQFPRLNVMKINYRIPDLKGFYERNTFTGEGIVDITCVDPSAKIYYTTDGSIPDQNSKPYTEPLRINETTEFVFRAFGANGKRGDIYRTSFIKSDMAPAVEVAEVAPGLLANWHEYRGLKCTEIENAPLNGTYPVEKVAIPNGVKGNIGLVINGYFNAPEDGIYTFSVLSDDGSLLYIDEDLVVENDGPHSPVEIAGQKVLAKGLHKLRVLYFDSNGGVLRMNVLGPDGKQIKDETNLYFHSAN